MDSTAGNGRATVDRPSFGAAIWAYRHYWRVDLVIAAILVAVSIALSRQAIDLSIARWCFRHGGSGWPDPSIQPWQALYDTPPIILAIIIPVSMLLLLLSALGVCNRRIRIRSIYLLLALWLGCAFIIETVLKENWGRPRPAQLIEFGGWLNFHAVMHPGVAGHGHSFPSSHSAVGYYLTVFYFLFRRDRPRLAFLGLLIGLALGTAIGLARIRVGGHFGSDIAWSAAIVFLANLLLYYVILNVPAREDDFSVRPRRPGRAFLLFLILPLTLHAVVDTLSPVHRSICHEFAGDQPIDAVRIATNGADVELTFTDQRPLRIAGHLTGRGLAGAAFRTHISVVQEDGNQIAEVRCTESGWLFHRGGLLHVRIPGRFITRLTLDTSGGAIRLAPHSLSPSNTVIDIRSGTLVP